MTRRISRAKRLVKDSGVPFAMPTDAQRAERLGAILHVMYLIFNEGYATTSGPRLQRGELSAEAIRLARMVRVSLPGHGETTGLLALMLLIDARRPARTGPDGELIPMAEQDRGLWNADQITEGVALITGALARGAPGPYQLQAAIAAIHDEAPSAQATDWPQISALYELLMRVSESPVVALNHAVAVAMARGAPAGLDLLGRLAGDERIARDHRLPAVRAHLLEMVGDRAGACDCYREAARRTTSLPQQRYLHAQVARLAADRGLVREHHRRFLHYVRETDDPTAKTVLLEDSAALVGLIFAFGGVGLHQLTGSSVWDGVASLLIGLTLSLVAFALGRTNKELLKIGRAHV